MKLLRDARPCEIDDPNVSIARWYILRTAGPGDDEMGYTTKKVGDARANELADYFCSLEVEHDERVD